VSILGLASMGLTILPVFVIRSFMRENFARLSLIDAIQIPVWMEVGAPISQGITLVNALGPVISVGPARSPHVQPFQEIMIHGKKLQLIPRLQELVVLVITFLLMIFQMLPPSHFENVSLMLMGIQFGVLLIQIKFVKLLALFKDAWIMELAQIAQELMPVIVQGHLILEHFAKI